MEHQKLWIHLQCITHLALESLFFSLLSSSYALVHTVEFTFQPYADAVLGSPLSNRLVASTHLLLRHGAVRDPANLLLLVCWIGAQGSHRQLHMCENFKARHVWRL